MNELFHSFHSLNDRLLGNMQGVFIGIVTDNMDPEKCGRVKVKLPVLNDQTELDWARVTTLMGGSERGTLFVPEVGDEVLVAFQMGDIREPIVIGSLWSKKNPPPPGKDDKNNIRKIKSRAGHEIILDDTDGDGKLTLKTKKGHQLELADKQDTIVLKEQSGQNVITIKGGSANSIEVTSGQTKIMLNNKGDVSIESMKAIKLKSTQVAIEASAMLDIKAGGSLNVKADGIISIQGAMVKIN